MRRFLTFMLFTLLVMGISAQDRTITGIVMDGDLDNSPLPGATVSQSGADGKVSQGTVTITMESSPSRCQQTPSRFR